MPRTRKTSPARPATSRTRRKPGRPNSATVGVCASSMIAVPAIVILVFYGMNLPADLAPRKSCCVYVGVGGVGGDRVGDRVEIVGRYILPRYRKDIVPRDRSLHRCSRTRGCASRRDHSHLRWRGLGRCLAQPDDDAARITRLAKVDMSLLHVRSEGTRIGQSVGKLACFFVKVELKR